MNYIMAIVISSLVASTLPIFIEPPQVEILAGTSYDFSIDYCTISIPPYISTMNAHCYCFYNPTTEISFNCSVPGPTFIFYAGDKVSMTWHNRMSGDSISDSSYFNKQKDLDITNIHTHGLHIGPDQDAISHNILPGYSHTYKYSVPSYHYPGTHWLHAQHHGSASFQVISGLFAALLIKYSEDYSYQLGVIDDSLMNMKENVLLFHWYYIITTAICNCSNTTEWKTYFYYPPQFNVSDCISGKECFQVFSHCHEYCSMPQTQRLLSGYTYNIQSDYNNNFQLFVVNGQFEPIIKIRVNRFRRLRFINAMTQYYIQYKFPTSHCEWYIIAIDGIFLYNNEVRSINSAPYFGEYLLPSGGRLDVIVKCDMLGTHSIVTSENTEIDADLFNIGRAPAGYTLFKIYITADGEDVVRDVPESYPVRPNYLTDLSEKEINICGCNTYNRNNNNTGIIIWNDTECGIVFNMKNNHNVNGLVFNPNKPSTSLEYGQVYEFTLIPHMHAYHQRIFPFQMQTDIGMNGFQAQAGDYHDTIGGPKNKQFKFRSYPIDFSGPQIIQCHQLTHQDMGMMTYIDILQPHQTCNAYTGEIIGNPTMKPTPIPTQNPTLSPTPIPTNTPTPQPTGSPTLRPTSKPTRSPLRDICPIEPGIYMDFIVLFDNSCGLSADTGDDLLEFVGEVISVILTDTNKTRVQTMATRPVGAPDIIVVFGNTNLQNDPVRYVQTVREFGQCTDGGAGSSDLLHALHDSFLYFDVSDNRIDKIIIISACQDDRDAICDEMAHELSQHDIDSYVINFMDLSDASNVITAPQTDNYLKCVADYDDTRVCSGELGHDDDEIIDNCLVSHVCSVPTKTPSLLPSTQPTFQPTTKPTTQPSVPPTKPPSKQPSISPTKQPSKQPSISPTKQPSFSPTKQPSISPTKQPSISPTISPTKQPSISPTKLPSISPTKQPSISPTKQPSKQPSMSPTKTPTISPTKQPTNKPTQNPTQSPTYRPTAEPTVGPNGSPTTLLLPPESLSTNQPTKASGECFVGEACQDTLDCCMDDVEGGRGITCSCYTKMSVTVEDRFCCILKGYDGCMSDNDCCKVRTLCYNGLCVDKNHPTTAPNIAQSTTSFPTTNPSKQPTSGPTKAEITEPSDDECFVGSNCAATEDCCSGSVDERLIGITCSGYTKMNENTDGRFCCIKKNYDGCIKDEDCCRIHSECFWGLCVNT